MTTQVYRNYQRNNKVINLGLIPDDIRDKILDNYKNQKINFTDLKFNVSHLNSGNNTIGSILVDKSSAGDAFNGIIT